MAQIGILTAFIGGLLSFLSPCVLPLAPPYLAFMAGTTLDRLTGAGGVDERAARRVRISAVFFVAGLATVFVALGATASLIGRALATHKETFSLLSGLVIFAMGAHFIGLRRAPAAAAAVVAAAAALALGRGADPAEFWADNRVWILALAATAAALRLTGWERFPFLMREARLEAGGAAGSYLGAYVIGLAFAFGWTPCIGPILGSILFLAAQEETLLAGVTLLMVYALGLGAPFLAAALFVRPFMRFMARFRRHLHRVEAAMGALLVAVGALMASGGFSALSFWLLDAFPALATIG
ncbi:cytochrome c biogenesis CcdA family protein [Oceanicella actignis]|uniref:cytochrome c biogenesis CcdA family protein n=1 Tax=Oceanicella actignis TaxID=1189325 RepID=UPI0011E8257A|nr:cytochrome c biogenesis protein CcdA [Oceanicella actignis]TYO90186.1 cytochrome c-type biogenesis protein [Oceanicella actignis]